LQDPGRWRERRAGTSEARQELREHGGSPVGTEGRRSGDSVRHVGVRRLRPHQTQVGRKGAVPLFRSRLVEKGVRPLFAQETFMAAENGQPLIKLDGVTKVFFTDEVETHALSGIHMEIGKGEYVS